MSDVEKFTSKPIHVMVVDDSKVQLQFAVDLCTEQGWLVVDTASDGMEALLKLKNFDPEHIDLLILDLEMPGLNGIDLLQELTRLHTNIPILILSSRELSLLEAVYQMGKSAGLNIVQVVQKPLHSQVLRSLKIAQIKKSIQSLAISKEELLAGFPQLKTVYIPSISIETGLIHHLSAHLAWPHPQYGLLLPAVYAQKWQNEKEFLRLIEVHHLEVFTQMQRWNSNGLSLAVKLELPLSHILSPLHARSILNQIQLRNLINSKITFEVSMAGTNPVQHHHMAALTLLRLHNIGLALRDHSFQFEWVRHIRTIPFSLLILSENLLNNWSNDVLISTLCHQSIALAHQLKMAVHAEGLDQNSEWTILHQHHCDSAQGALIGEPLFADEVVPWLKENQASLRQLAQQNMIETVNN
jgi:EAL domain-containing protein (putative c-di-GMP-specific phosphodiesterase class I)